MPVHEPRPESWIDAAARAAAGRDREFLASPFVAEVSRIDREQGSSARATFLRRVLHLLVERGRPHIRTLNLPDAVKFRIEREYARVQKNLADAADDHYDLASHSVRCDFRIVGFGRIPVGLHHIEVGGVPRRLIWSGGAGQGLQVLTLLAQAGGWAPFYVSHFTHGIKPWAFLMVYNLAALAEWHRNAAECLRMNPHIRGLLATSWWYDPQLSRVAPHLAFLREGSLAHGGTLLRSGPTEGARKDALAHSPERQRLHANGEYLPVSYAVLWTRETLMKWAAQTRS